MNYDKHIFPNYGVMSATFSETELEPLKQEINKIQENFDLPKKANSSLAGQIQKEFFLSDSVEPVAELVLPFTQLYHNEFQWANNIQLLDRDLPFKLGNLWVNFQRKHEFNPPHVHAGIYSFVIWIKVPFDIAEEQAMFEDSRYSCSGNFTFQFTDIFGKICTHYIQVDKSWENKMLFFPSCLTHSVLPFFTSDDYRISVSGNILLRT